VGALQPIHLIVILIIVLIIFGAGRLTEVGGALGKGVRDFRASVESDKTDPARPASATRFCPSCGRQDVAGGRFCQQCGGSLPA
jgi:sec-independent protein translocase protein TatA